MAWPFSLFPCCRPSGPHCHPVPLPQRQHFPRFSAVAACLSHCSPTTDPLRHILLSPPFHNGTIFRISLPLRHDLSRGPLLQAFWTALPSCSSSTTAAFPAFRCRCGMTFLAAPLIQTPWATFYFRPLSTTAAFPAFRCRCGMAFLTDPLLQTPCATFSFRHLSTTAAFPAFLCRCGIAFLTTPLLQAFWTALPSCSSSTTALFPAILCRCGSSLRKVQAKVAFHRHLPEPAEPAGTVSLSVNRMPSRWSTSCWKMTAV